MRRSTRIRWQTPVLLTSLDPSFAVVERCATIIVNLHGCAVRTGCKFPDGTPVQVQVNGNVVTGRIVEAASLSARENLWILGITLDQPGNYWGIEDAPGDWNTPPEAEKASPVTSDEQVEASSVAEKFTFWPSAFGPKARTTDASNPSHPLLAACPDGQGSPTTETFPTNGSEHIQAEYADAVSAAVGHLRAEIERRAQSEWGRLRSCAEEHVEHAETQLRSELENGLTAWREERAGVEGELQELRRMRDQLDGLLHKAAEVLRAEVVPIRDQVTEQARGEVQALIHSFEEKAAQTEAQRAEIETRTAAEWMRWRDQAERQVQEARTQLHSELESGLTAWREERAVVEKKLQELLPLRDRIETRVNEAAGVLRGEIVPLRTQLIEHAREEVQRIILEFQEKAAAQWTARELTASSASMQSEEMRNECVRLVSQLQRRADEDKAAGEAISSQLAQILQARAEQDSLLRQHRTEQEAAQQAIREQADRACQAREAIESLVRSLPDTIATQIQERAQAMAGQLRESLAQDLSTQVRAAVGGLDAHVRHMAGDASQGLRQELSQEFARQEKEFRGAIAAGQTELLKLEASVRDCASTWNETIATESERTVAGAREELQNVIAEQQAEIGRAGKDVMAALQATAGNLLTSMRNGMLNDLAVEHKQALQLAQCKINELLCDGQKTVEAALQQTAKDALGSLRQEVLNTFEQRQQSFETTHASATAQLQQLEKRTEELTALVDVELQAHTDGLIRETVAQITQQLQEVSASVREVHIGRLQEEADHSLGVLVRQANEAGAKLHVTLDSLQKDKNAGETASAQLQHAVHEAQAWLDYGTQQFDQTVHDAFLRAAGEIRGRIQQAVEMASAPIEGRSREIQEEIAEVARHQAEELHRQLDTARHRLQTTWEESQSAAESALQKRSAEALDRFQQDAEQFAQRSTDRWQSALTDTLAAIPQILAARLPAGHSTAPTAGADDCADENRPGAGDGRTQGT